MTVDERMEALTHTLEQIAGLQLRGEERLVRIEERFDGLTQTVELLGQIQTKTEKEIRKLGRCIRTIVLDHEGRLLALEGEKEDDEEEQHG